MVREHFGDTHFGDAVAVRIPRRPELSWSPPARRPWTVTTSTASWNASGF